MSDKTGGPAFPNVPSDVQYEMWDEGMTLRDYFAAKFAPVIVSKWNGAHTFDEGGFSYSDCAEQAYLLADAMLKAREN